MFLFKKKKHWITGAAKSKIWLILGKTHSNAERHRQFSIVVFNRENILSGSIVIQESLSTFGHDDREAGGHWCVLWKK